MQKSSCPKNVEVEKEQKNILILVNNFLISPITKIINFILLIFMLYQLWIGEKTVITSIVSGVLWVLLVIGFLIVGYQKKEEETQIEWSENRTIKIRTPKYPKTYKLSRIILIIILFLSIIFVGEFIHDRNEKREKIVVLVAEMDNKEDQTYRMTDLIVDNLRSELEDTNEIVIERIGYSISGKQGGSELAKQIGEEHLADLVIWGWYSATPSDVFITINIENLNNTQILCQCETDSLKNQVPADDLNTFTIQQKVGSEIGTLILYLSGLFRYDAMDYKDALDRFTKVIDNPNSSEDLIRQSYVYFYRANTYYLLGEYTEALSDYNRAIELDPEIPELYQNRGNVYFFQHEYNKAIDDYNIAIILGLHEPEVFSNRGNCYRELQKYNLAFADYEESISINPRFRDAYYNQGSTYYDLGQYDKAIEKLDTAIDIDPEYVIAYILRGLCFKENNLYESALKDFNKAVKISPYYSSAYKHRGLLFAEIEEYEKAEIDLDHALELDPEYIGEYYNNLGMIYLMQNLYKEALESFDKAIDSGLNSPKIYYERGLAQAEFGQYQGALIDLDEAILLDREYKEAYFLKGKIYIKLESYNNSIDVLTKAIKIDPGNEYFYYRALAYYYLQSYTASIHDLNRAISLLPDNKDAYYLRGEAYLELEDYEYAIKDFSKVIQLDSNYSEAYIDRGIAYYHQKQYEDAFSDYEKALNLDYDNPEIYIYRGLMYAEMENYEMAISDFENAKTLPSITEIQKSIIKSFLDSHLK